MKKKLNGHVHLKEDELHTLVGKLFLNSSPLEQLDGCKKCIERVRKCVGRVVDPDLVSLNTTIHHNV